MKKGSGIFGEQFAVRTAKGESDRWAKAARKVNMNRAVWVRMILNREADKIIGDKK